jgi:hypothetical protein
MIKKERQKVLKINIYVLIIRLFIILYEIIDMKFTMRNHTTLQLKLKKTTHIQLQCNYLLGITTNVQLPP